MNLKKLRESLKKEYGNNWKLPFIKMSGAYSDLGIDAYIERLNNENKKNH